MNENPDDKATEGLSKSFHVQHLDDPDGKHAKCDFFVLDPLHDPLAKNAVLQYAQDAALDGQDQLAVDLIAWIGEVELRKHHPQLAAELEKEVSEREEIAERQESYDGNTVDVGYVHVLDAPDGDCVATCPHPDHKTVEPGGGLVQPGRRCPIHHQTDCSPLLNGCSELTKTEGIDYDTPMPHADGVTPLIDREENKGGYSMHVDPTDGKRI